MRTLTTGLLQGFSVLRSPLMRELRQPGRSVHSWGQHSVGGGRCGVSPSSSEPEGGRGAEAVSPAARDPTSTEGSPSCVPRSLPHSGEKPPGTEMLRFGVGSPSDLHFPFNLTQCGDWLLLRHWSKDMCLRFSQFISMLKMFSLDTVLAVITVYKAGQNPKARLVVSRGPWVWVQPGGRGPRGLPRPHPHSRASCPEVTFRVAAGRSPCTGPGRAAAQIVLITSGQAEVPVPVGRARGFSGKAGVSGTTSKCRWCRLHFWH